MASNIPCRYFLNGSCRRGDSCEYFHDSKPKASRICKFFLTSKCLWGDDCRNEHIGIEKDQIKVTPLSYSSTSNQIKTPNASTTYQNYYEKKVGCKHDDFEYAETIRQLENLPSTLIFDSIDPCIASTAEHQPYFYQHNYHSQDNDGTIDGYIEDGDYKWNEDFEPRADLATCTPLYNSGEQALVDGTYEGGIDAKEDWVYDTTANGWEHYGDDGLVPYYPIEEYDVCEHCGGNELVRDNPEQRESHIKLCKIYQEEISKAKVSEDLVCSVCMEVVWQKMPFSRRRFGILSHCDHIYCLECIRKWRSEDGYDNQVVRACPECRIVSNFVTPSMHWYGSNEEKMKIINKYKEVLREKPCNYFKEEGECPFNDSCFYHHDEKDRKQGRLRWNASGFSENQKPHRLSDFFDFIDDFQNMVFRRINSLNSDSLNSLNNL